MQYNVWDYFNARDREIKELSLRWAKPSAAYTDQAGDTSRGIMLGRLDLDDRGFIDVHEEVWIVDGAPRRKVYGYYLIVDGVEAWGQERDSIHGTHRHVGPAHVGGGAPSSDMTLKDFATRCWDLSSDDYLTPIPDW